MKRILIAYIAILVGIFAVLSWLGRNSDYAIEQMVWKVQKEYLDIVKDPKVIPEQTYVKVIKGYQKIIDRYPNSTLTPRIRFLMGHVYFLKKDYETARKKFNELIKLYPSNKALHAEALGAVGRTYEIENDWPQAQRTYDRIMADYPDTPTGFGIPLYLANHYKEQNDYQKTMDAYDRAIKHYLSLTQSNPGSPIEYNALRYLSNCYLDQKRWREGVETLGEILQKYAKGNYMNIQTADTIIKTINAISVYQIKDYDLPVQIYQNIIQQNPDHPLNAYFQKMIDALNTLKAKSVQVSPAQ